MTETRFLRCVNDPARRSLCDGCTSPLTCSGASDMVDAQIRQWELRRVEAARLGVCSHQLPEPTEGPGIAASRPAWIAGAVSACLLLAVIAAWVG